MGLFVAGAVLSIYEVVSKILRGSGSHGSFFIGYIVLGAAFVFESGALFVSAREFRRTAHEASVSFWQRPAIPR